MRQLAANLIARRNADQGAATVILGAGASVSSGIPTWPVLADQVCTKFHISTKGLDPIDALVEWLNRPDIPYSQRYTVFQPYLGSSTPSIGYAHLAQLVKDGLISTILTTNWDSIAEKALFRVIPVEQLKLLVRGEIDDDAIADVLAWRPTSPTIVKLHGDYQSRRFMLGSTETRQFSPKLLSELSKRVAQCTFLVGQSAQDADILTMLLVANRDGSLYHVRFDPTRISEIDDTIHRVQAQVVQGKQQHIFAAKVTLNIGDFDTFFTQLDLAVQQELTAQRRSHLRVAEQSILAKEKVGIGYINYTRITDLIEEFTFQVRQVAPDLILFIDDPSAPGGMEIQRRMVPVMRRNKMNIPHAVVRIEGQSGSRTHNRRVTSDLAELPMDGVKTVLILDSISFSGNTVKLARDAIREKFPHVLVRQGVLVVSQQLHERQQELAKSDPSEALLSQVVTDRHEIFFPWGVTQTTSAFDRRFEGAVKGEERHVKVAKRPWGTIEVLADEERASVRLLTIEAHRKLSFQRHLCRDELFVALDDNIGLEICAEELEKNASAYDERVRSLILEKGDYVLIPRGVWHRTKASTDRVRLLEVGFGLYDQDNDIERRWDDYERERAGGAI